MTQNLTIHYQQMMDNIQTYLTPSDQEQVLAYINSGGELPPLSAARAFFELFLSGSSIEDIHKLNPSYPKESINWCRVKFDWDRIFHETVISLQNRIQAKVIKAQIEAVGLYTDLIAAANKKHGHALKKYLQTGDEEVLSRTLEIRSVSQLASAINGLSSLLGQESMQKLGNPNPKSRQPSKEEGSLIDIEPTPDNLSPLQRAAQKLREADKNE